MKDLDKRSPEREALAATWALIRAATEATTANELKTWIPKGSIEADDEYARRLNITPFAPETPRKIHERAAAIFEGGMTLTNVPDIFAKNAGDEREDFETVAETAAEMALAYGECAAWLIPSEGRTYVALFAAPQILETRYRRGQCVYARLAEEDRIHVFKANKILTYKKIDDDWQQVDRIDTNSEELPLAFLKPWPTRTKLGKPTCAKNANADLAAVRVLSDIMWTLYLLGNPILTLTTARDDEDIKQLVNSASRFFPLRGRQGDVTDEEKLAFVKLDVAGLEKMYDVYRHLRAIAKDQNSDEASATPIQSSGVAQAWTFKTGEQRLLARLSRATERFCNDILDAFTRETGNAGGSVSLSKRFDFETPGETIDRAEKLLTFAQKAQNKALEAQAVTIAAGTLELSAREKIVLTSQ